MLRNRPKSHTFVRKKRSMYVFSGVVLAIVLTAQHVFMLRATMIARPPILTPPATAPVLSAECKQFSSATDLRAVSASLALMNRSTPPDTLAQVMQCIDQISPDSMAKVQRWWLVCEASYLQNHQFAESACTKGIDESIECFIIDICTMQYRISQARAKKSIRIKLI